MNRRDDKKYHHRPKKSVPPSAHVGSGLHLPPPIAAARPYCSICGRERYFLFSIVALFCLMFTLHEFNRNSANAWYSSTYLTLIEAHANECIRTDAALSTHVPRHDQYWTNSLRQIAGQEEEKTFKLRSEDEYKLVFESILNCTQPCNVLVFGVAWDAMLLMEANWLGKTVFLEDNFKWQALVRNKAPCMNSYLVHYSTRLRDWPLYEEPKNIKKLEMTLPLEVATTPWDIIVVRGPESDSSRLGAWDNPGRMQSIYAASQLSRLYFRYPPRRDAVTVIVSDADQMVEKRFSSMFLGDKNLAATAGSFKQYVLKDGFDLSLPMPIAQK